MMGYEQQLGTLVLDLSEDQSKSLLLAYFLLTLYRRIQRAFQRRGVLDTARLALVQLLETIQKLSPSSIRARVAEWTADTAFDRTYGVDTGGKIHPSAMHDVESKSWVFGERYQATMPDVFQEMIGSSSIKPHCYSFIDFGSGKGRVLLLASQLPFRRVVGVEYSPSLHRIAALNLSRVRLADHRSAPVESVCMDATRFPIPEEPVVLFFYNPFDGRVMEIVRDNVVRSYEDNPRSIIVIYHNPQYSDLWDAVGFLRRHAWSNVKGREYVIYKPKPSQQFSDG
jgi:SAM-dependent methyltransferase